MIASTVWASFHLNLQFFIPSTQHFRNVNNAGIALTFDDGPHPEWTPRVLNLLAENNIKATFFLIGKNAEQHPEIVKRISDEGHTIGNHSYHHEDKFPMKKRIEIQQEIIQNNALLKELTGKEIHYFRPPFGVSNPRIAKGIKDLKMQTIGWSIRSFDTVAKDVQSITKRVLKNPRQGDVILLHDTQEKTLTALSIIIESIQKRGIGFESIESLYKKQ